MVVRVTKDPGIVIVIYPEIVITHKISAVKKTSFYKTGCSGNEKLDFVKIGYYSGTAE